MYTRGYEKGTPVGMGEVHPWVRERYTLWYTPRGYERCTPCGIYTPGYGGRCTPPGIPGTMVVSLQPLLVYTLLYTPGTPCPATAHDRRSRSRVRTAVRTGRGPGLCSEINSKEREKPLRKVLFPVKIVRDLGAQTAPLSPLDKVERLDNFRVTPLKSPLVRDLCA